MTPETLASILGQIIEKSLEKKSGDADIHVMLSPADAEKLKKGLLAKLKDKLKEGVAVNPSSDIAKGFMISFDGGKSAFDFTDAALTEYVSAYLNEELAALIKEYSRMKYGRKKVFVNQEIEYRIGIIR